jgi:hypothetical protein
VLVKLATSPFRWLRHGRKPRPTAVASVVPAAIDRAAS